MRRRPLLLLAMALLVGISMSAQRGPQERGGPSGAANRPRANQGRIPPAPERRAAPAAPREAEHLPTGHVNETPHVNNNHWYGHEAANDPRFHMDHPFEHGRFAKFGPSFRYNVLRVDLGRHMFWLPDGFYFQVAAWDWALCADWCWDCGDDFVIYEDQDHVGWYLLYNIHTGGYVHVLYMGT